MPGRDDVLRKHEAHKGVTAVVIGEAKGDSELPKERSKECRCLRDSNSCSRRNAL